MFHCLLYPLIGSIAGLFAGLLGIGGGSVVVPGLAFVFKESGFAPDAVMHMAAGTSLAVMVFTACSSVRAHHVRGNIDWAVVFRFLPGILIGVVLGAILASFLSTRILELIFGVFLIFIAVRIFLLNTPKSTRYLPNFLALFFISLLIGGKSGLLGIGGGALTIPFLIYCNFSIRRASGTTAACTLPIAIIGVISFIVVGYRANLHIPYSTGYIYWPAVLGIAVVSVIFAPIGAAIAGRTNTDLLKRIFAVFIFIVGLRLLF